jgi:hypothetical protein
MLAFAPITTLERINDPTWNRPGRQLFDPGALTLTPGHTTADVLVDHDHTRVIGTVHTLTRVEDIDGPWLCGIATIHDRPDWLKRDTPVSVGYKPAGTSHDLFGRGIEVVRRGLLTELSVLPPWSSGPAEPRAKVLTLHPTETAREPKVIRRARREPDYELDELRRRLDWHEAHGTGATFEQVVESMKRELRGLAR